MPIDPDIMFVVVLGLAFGLLLVVLDLQGARSALIATCLAVILISSIVERQGLTDEGAHSGVVLATFLFLIGFLASIFVHKLFVAIGRIARKSS